LVQGKPEDRTVALVGVDKTLLQQRHDFLRPDSLVAVIMVTDENDSALDPLALGGQASLFFDSSFKPKRGSDACKTSPASEECRSCVPNSSGPLPAGCEGAVSVPAAEIHPNLRPIRMRERFGVNPQFPLERYIRGFLSTTVPNRNEEHPVSSSGFPEAYLSKGEGSCTNPLFANSLPLADEVDESDVQGPVLCQRLPGKRTPEHVFFGVIGGVPWQLLAENPLASIRAVRFKASLTESDWNKIVGRDPLRWDYQDMDPHMIESWLPRPGLATSAPVTGADTADPMHGREWDTLGSTGEYEDLQYACTFPLPSAKDCPKGSNSCDCESENAKKTPLCETRTSSRQVRGKAYPSLRPLTVARYLGKQAVVGSICPVDLTDNGDANPNYGYRPLLTALVDRMKPVLPKP
jgi:hypothetical protein